MATPFKPPASATARLRAISPLLESIAREVEERAGALERLLVRRGRLDAQHKAEHAALDAECSAHRLALRRARIELESMGCLLVSTRPCAFCIAVDQGHETAVVFWRMPASRAV